VMININLYHIPNHKCRHTIDSSLV
jgi:hypothetical protein